MTTPKRCLLLWSLLLAPPLAGGVGAQGRGVEVRLVSPALVEVEPGEILTLSFRVANRGDTTEELAEELRLPEGWSAVLPLFEFTLGPGRETTRLAVVRAGRTAPAGDHELVYTATSLRDYALADTAAARAAVRPLYDLALVLEGPPPEQVIAGEPFSFSARMLNRGNVELGVHMSARFSGADEAAVTPASFRLAAGESQALTVSARASPAEHRLRRQHLRLEAGTDREVAGRSVAARMNVPVEVVPLVAGQDPCHRYPLELAGYLGGNEDDVGVQLGLQGDGSLDEAGRRRLVFFVRAPDGRGQGVLGRRDEYWARYLEPSYTVKAGDQAYTLSPLTSSSRYGRGLGVDAHPTGSRLGAGLYHVQDRWAAQQRNDTGGYLSLSPWPGSTLRMNLLTLHYESWADKAAGRDNLVSLQGDFRLRETDQLGVEVGYSDSDRGPGGSDTAWRLDYRGQVSDDLRYTLSGRRAGAEYAGRYPDSALYTGTVVFPLVAALRGDLSYSRYESNLDPQPQEGPAPREDLFKAGVTAPLPRRWRLTLAYERYERTDAQPEPSNELREHGARVGLGRSTDVLGYRAEVRRAWTEDLVTGETHTGWNYTLDASYQPSRALFLSAHGGFGDDHAPRDSRLLRRGRNLGGTARWQPTRAVSAYLSYSRRDESFPDEPLRERTATDHYGAGLSCRLPNEHRLELTVRRSESSQRDAETSYYASYAVPFALPLGRKRSVGTLTGRVYRADEPGAPGVAGAVVYVDGTAARTDRDGTFTFRTLPPGEYHVRVDERSIGLDLVPVSLAPAPVRVQGAGTARTELALTRGGRVSGRILVTPAGGPAGSGPNGSRGGAALHGLQGINGTAGNGKNGVGNGGGDGLGNLLVELSRPGETRRTVSDRRGRFLFEQLHPGEWTLKVHGHNLPDQHVLEEETSPVTLAPGGEQDLTVRVLPRIRQIRFVDEGRLWAPHIAQGKPR